MKTIIILLGGPGAGKGTQAHALTAWLRIPHISTGELLRHEVALETEPGLRAKTAMETGRLVSDEIVNELIARRVCRDDCRHGFILDGYPRSVSQAITFQRTLADPDRVIVVDIETDLERLIERLVRRKRFDDSEDVIRERFKIYREETLPLMNLYRKWKIYQRIDGMQPIEYVTRDMIALIEDTRCERRPCRTAAQY